MAFTQRLKAAYQAFRATKAAVPYPSTGGMWNSYGWGNYNSFGGLSLDYQREAGNLGASSLVMAAVNWTGTVLPEAPVEVRKRKSPKVFEPIPDHEMIELLEHPTRYYVNDQPREYYSGELLWKAFAYSWIIDGNVYFRKVRNSLGQVIQLWYEPHFTCRPRWPQDGAEFISYYEVLRNGRWYRVEPQDIVHFRYGIDPCAPQLGLSPVASVYREIFTDNERARYSALILKNGGVIPFLISPEVGAPVVIDPAEIKAEWEYRTTGENVGKPMVLSWPLKVQQIGQSPDKLLIDKASTIPEERFAAVICIPAAVLGFGVGLDQTKVGATMRELREQASESFVLPTYRLIEGELRSQLLPDFGDVKDLRVGHDLSQVRILQDDREKLFTREIAAYQGGLKTRAEGRSALGLDTTPADDVFYLSNSATLISPDEHAAPAPEPPAVQPALLGGNAPKQLVNGLAKEGEMN